jgi:hypothetical protein
MKTIDLAVTVDQPEDGARTRILDGVGHRLRSSGFTERVEGNTVKYRPKFIGLPTVWLVRVLSGEQVTFTFEEQGRTTEMRITGQLRQRAYAEVTEAFGGS